MKRIAAFICSISLLAAVVTITGFNTIDAGAYSRNDLENVVRDAVGWMDNNGEPESYAGSRASDYCAIAYARAGIDFDTEEYLDKLDVIARIYNRDTLASDMQRTLMAVIALGGDAQYIGGRDLVADSTYFRAASSPLDKHGIEGYIGALTALDAGKYTVPEDWAEDNREDMIRAILAVQKSDGSFEGSTLLTAKSIIALAPYNNSTAYTFTNAEANREDTISCGAAIYNAIEYLSGVQKNSGDFENLEETAFVSMAMDSIGIDQNDERLKKNGYTVMDALLNFQRTDGGFPSFDNSGSDDVSTAYALCALISNMRVIDKKGAFFDFTSRDKLDLNLNRETPAPEATAAPKATATSKATAAPKATATPKTSTKSGSSSTASGSSSAASGSKTTAKPSTTQRPTVTKKPSASTLPSSSAVPRVTPKPTQKPDLVGPVQLVGPDAPTPTPDADELAAQNKNKIPAAVPIAGAVVIALILAALALIKIKGVNGIKDAVLSITGKQPREKEIYHAKSHLKIDERRKFEKREKYKERRRFER